MRRLSLIVTILIALILMGGLAWNSPQLAKAQTDPVFDSSVSYDDASTFSIGSADINTAVTAFQDIIITNPGGTALTITGVNLNDPETPDVFSIIRTPNTATPFTLAAGGAEELNIEVSCTPRQAKVYTATLVVVHNGSDANQTTAAAGNTATYNLSCTGLGPVMTVDQPVPNFAFGNVDINTNSNAQTLVVRNSGSSSNLRLTGSASITGSNANEFTLNAGSGYVRNTSVNFPGGGIPSGSTLNVQVRCSPISAFPNLTPLQATLVITHDGQTAGGTGLTSPQEYTLTCTVETPTFVSEYPVVPGAATLNYGTTTIGDTSLGSISVKNTGDAPLRITLPVTPLGGTNPGDFSLDTSTVPSGDILKGEPLRYILVSCTPTSLSPSPRTATLTLNTNDPSRPSVIYSLICPVIAPEYNGKLGTTNLASGGLIDFGTVFAGGSDSRTVTVENLATNDSTLVVSSVTFGGADAAQFSVTSPTTFPIEIADDGASQNIVVTCNAPAVDTYTATMTINNNDADEGGITYNLECDGALPEFSSNPAGTIVFDPDPSFPNGVTAETFRITNTGGAQLVITNALLTGSNSGNFLFTLAPPQQNNQSSWYIINPGAFKDVEIQCIAKTQGAMTGGLELTTNDPDEGTVTYNFDCTGFAASGYSSVPTPGSTITLNGVPAGAAATSTIVITNTGVGAFNITGISFTNPSTIMTVTQTAGDTTVSGTGSGDSATVTVSCQSASNATESNTVQIGHTSSGSPALYPVNCTIAAPAPNYVTTTPPADITVAQTQSATTTIRITNNGTATLNLSSLAFSDATAGRWTSNFPGAGDTIPHTGTNFKDYTITCNGQSSTPNTYTTNITIDHNDTNGPEADPRVYTIDCDITTFAPVYTTVTAPSNITTSQFAGAPNNRTRLTFENTGNAPLNITSVNLGTNPGNRFSRVSALPTNVANGATPDPFIDFACDTATTTVGPVSTTISVNHNGAGSPAQYTIECTVGAAQAGYGSSPAFSTTTTPTTINFPEAVEGGADTTFTFVITETGNADLVVSDIQFTGSNFSIQPAFPVTGATIPNNSNTSLSLTLVCDATTAGTYTETMTVFHNGTNTPTPGETEYTVFCNVQDLVPAFGSNPNPGSTITVNTSVGATGGNTATFTIFESGTGPLNISSITAGGVNPSKFTVTTSRGNAPFTIADAEGPVTVTVACDPSAAGAFNATLAIGHSGETGNTTPANYNLACNVAPPSPEYTAAPASLAFTGVIFGTTSAEQAVTVTNAGGANLTVSAILTGGESSQFAFVGYTSGTSQTVTPGGTLPFRITCTPISGNPADNLRDTNLQITHNDPAGTVVTYPITCTGASAPAPSLNVEPGSLEFTGTSSSTVGQTKSISITNGVSGSAPLNWVVSESLSWLVCSPTSGTTTNETDTVNCTATPGSLTSSSSPLSGIVTVTTTGLSPTQSDTVNVTFTITDPAPKFESEPTAGSTLTINTTPSVAGTSNVKIKNTGTATLSGITVRLSNTSMTQFSITNGSGITSLAAGTESTITVQCVSSTLTTLNNTLEVLYTQGGSQQTASFPIVCNVTTTGTATGTTGGTTGGTGTGTPGVTQCPANQVFSKPFPQNASGEFLMVNCFLVTGPGTFNIPLTQVLTTPMSTVTQTNIATIQANPGLMSVWRMGSWFLVPSSYNAANATYSFDAISGTQIYAFFYGAITQPVGAQGNPTTTTTTSGGVAAGTATGNVPDAIQDLPQPRDNRPRAILISVGVTLLLGVAFMAITDRRKARRRTEI